METVKDPILTGQKCYFLSRQPPNQRDAKHQTAQTEKSELPITEFQNLDKSLAPGAWRHEWHKALNDQHQRHGQPKGGAVQTNSRFYFLGLVVRPPRMDLKNSELEGSSTITSLFLENVDL